jgi:hypothetical protein
MNPLFKLVIPHMKKFMDEGRSQMLEEKNTSNNKMTKKKLNVVQVIKN